MRWFDEILMEITQRTKAFPFEFYFKTKAKQLLKNISFVYMNYKQKDT